MKIILLSALLVGCGAPFVPLYEGEPECGRPTVGHAIEGEPCDEKIVQVACDCEERRTLECDGVWRVRHWGCSGGLSVHVEKEPLQ